MKKNKYTDWHRLFGITLMDYFTHSKYRVELEKDLSIQQQFLDVVILEQQQGRIPDPLPDGLENLKVHNLLTYKSHQESLRDWSLDELLGHYVNYRKHERQGKKLLPARDFQLYAVCTRFPDALEKQYRLYRVKQGVYRVRWGSKQVRLIVTSQVPKTPKIRCGIYLAISVNRWRMRKPIITGRTRTRVLSLINCFIDIFKRVSLCLILWLISRVTPENGY